MSILEMKQKIEKRFFIFYIIVFKFGAANSHKSEEGTCHRQPMC